MKRTALFFSLLLLLLFSTACTVMTPLAPAPTTAPTEAPSGPAVVTATPGSSPAAETPAPVVTEDAIPTLSAEQFDAALIQAIEAKDFATLRGLMGSRFVLAGWRSEGRELSPEAALSELSMTAMASGATPAASTGMDTSALLEGADPLNFFPPDAVRAVYFDFVGPNGTDQALAIIGRDPATGERYWKGILVAMGGFRQDSGGEMDELNQFSQQLGSAVLSHDFNAMRSLMDERFSIATLDTGTLDGTLYEYNSGDALDQLKAGTLAAGSDPVILWNTDIPALLGGRDPLAFWGPVYTPIRAMHITGLGLSAAGEAVLVINRDSSGRLYWHGILLPKTGDTFQPSSPEPVGDALPTSVRYVMALDDLNVRTGPGMNFAVEGKVSEGMIAQVSGVSADSQWWQIVCTQDSSGRCWISADASLTEPTSAP